MKNELFPDITSDIFTQRKNNHNNLRNIDNFEIPFVPL